jgi:hypothetical protein
MGPVTVSLLAPRDRYKANSQRIGRPLYTWSFYDSLGCAAAQDIAFGAFLLTHPQILWYPRVTEPGAGDYR